MSNIALISLYGIENNGIRSIASVLRQGYFDPYLIFFKRWTNNDIRLPSEREKDILISLLKELNIEIVGISFTSPFLKVSEDITRSIKDTLRVKVVWGGNHATARPQECLEICDFVCQGEGEYAMLDLARAYFNKYPFDQIKNISYKLNGPLICQGLRPLIQDLDSLPHPEYAGKDTFFIDGRRLQKIDPLSHSRELRIFASRGCPFKCSYCYNSILRRLYKGQSYHRIRGAESVISEIEYALSRLKLIKKIKFDDDTFLFPKAWIDEFSDKYKKRVGLPFEILYNAQTLDYASLAGLKDAGLRRIQVGIQTGSKNESQEVYGRNLPKEKIRRFADIAKILKLDVVYDVILDNPLASPADKEELIDFLLSLPRPFNLFIYSLTVFPGTELCELFLRRGLIKPEGVEGRANKSFHQFRLSFSYPRAKEELFVACIVSLTSKKFLPKSFISLLKRSAFLKRHPLPLKWFAHSANTVKLSHVLIKMLLQGDLSIVKFREYGSPKRYLIQ